ncbi:MAG TPA: dihydrodipicolinate synthase family protein [Mycobacteriales bacterium]|nr:dihydrodipicolinate synthase family protein [Mycobacteriales bacterium]
MFEGVHVAVTTPFDDDGSLLLDRFEEHCAFLVDAGCQGVVVCGSMGEYATLTPQERQDLVAAAVRSVGDRALVTVGTGAYNGVQARAHAEAAGAAGAHAVMSLPPTGYRAATPEELLAHFRLIAKAGLPMVVYNNPADTGIDMPPAFLAQLAEELPEVRAVKDFSGDVPRVYELRRTAPRLQLMVGADTVALESFLAGAVGWIAGFANALPESSVALLRAGCSGDVATGVQLNAALLPLFGWDVRPVFVQAVKAAMDECGRYGGPTRLPRLPLPEERLLELKRDVALARGV